MDVNLSQSLQDLLTSMLLFLPKLITALVVFVAGLVLAGVVSRALKRAFERRNADPEITLLAMKVTRWAVVVLGTIVALDQVDFNVTTFLAGLGILGFTVGFALQDVSKNFVAGLLLLLQQPFDIGEMVQVGEYTGKVQLVDLRATEIRTLDGRLVLIPNSDVFTNPIVNLSRPDSRRIELEAGVSYESDLERVRQLALEAIRSVEGLMEEPPPQVVYHTFGGSTIDMTILFWFDNKTSNPQVARDQGLAAVKSAFEKAKVEMPFPTQVVIQQN
jgi:small conductance mechanosensitive channel